MFIMQMVIDGPCHCPVGTTASLITYPKYGLIFWQCDKCKCKSKWIDTKYEFHTT